MPTKILLVDDSLFDVMLTCQALRSQATRYEITVACDGAEAYSLLQQQQVDLLLLDIKMPRVDGFELMRKLGLGGALPAPTVVISSSGLQADQDTARSLGAIAYVHKALDYKQFSQELVGTLEQHGF